MTREEAINVLEQRCGYTRLQYATALRVAIDALHAQQTHEKLDRSRLEGCFLCKSATYLDGDVCVSGIYYVGLSEFCFCPNCGRPLTEEAWAELERRMNDG